LFPILAEVRDTLDVPINVRPNWSSTSSTVATVDTFGFIRVHTSGTVRIIASKGTHADTLLIDAARVTFSDVAVGSALTCGLTVLSDVFCWGIVPLYDSLTGKAFLLNARAPVKVAHVAGVQRVTIGWEHLCALANQAVLCWGGNRLGMLGLGTTDTVFHPTPTALPGLAVTALEAGSFFTCVLESGGGTRCWGYNSNGELGDSSYGTIQPQPVSVLGGIAFATVTTGQTHACGLDFGGIAYCWGNGSGGIAGPEAGTPACIQTGSGPKCVVPVPVDTGLHFSAIDTWAYHTCGLTASGAVWCWGANGRWQLGSQTAADHSEQPVIVSGNVLFASVVIGNVHSCGLTAAGDAWCWGDNGAGQIGKGLVENGARYSSPVAVVGGYSFSFLRGGGNVTCGMAASRVYCWGDNYWGQVGDGSDFTEYQQPLPSEVAGQQ
jgi:alpha-tubulin suppressor-like RCC1 family protein